MICCFASWLKYLQQTDWIDRDCPGLVVRCGAMCGVSWSGVYTPTCSTLAWSTLDPNPPTSSSWCSEVSNFNAGVFYSVGGWRDMVATARVSVVTHNAPALCPGILIYRLFRALAQLSILPYFSFMHWNNCAPVYGPTLVKPLWLKQCYIC